MGKTEFTRAETRKKASEERKGLQVTKTNSQTDRSQFGWIFWQRGRAPNIIEATKIIIKKVDFVKSTFFDYYHYDINNI